MELRHLRYFTAVAEELHFGRAAARLRVAQPALSQQIKQLEQELGVSLLARTKRRVALTEPGRLFLDEARRTLAQAATAAEVARRAAAGELGRLRVGYVDVALWGVLPKILRAYRERQPQVALTLHELLPSAQLAALVAGELDVGIGPPAPAAGPYVGELVSDDPIVVALPERHPLLAHSQIALEQLAAEAWVLTPGGIRSRLRDLVTAACAAAGFSPRVAQEARQLDALIALVSAGLGVTLVPRAAEQLRRVGVAFRPLRGVDLSLPLVASWHPATAPATLASFLDVLREVTRE